MSVHVGVLDDDHKKMVAMIDDLFSSIQDGRGKNAVANILDKLVVYTVEHFAREEALFDKTGYPDAAPHKKAHAEMTKRVLAYQQKYRDEKTDALVVEIANFLWTWLVDHDLTFDKKYSPYLNSKGVF